MSTPTHYRPGGGFRNPWPGNGSPERGFGALLRWQLERLTGDGVEPNPPAGSLPLAPGDVVRPRAATDELRVTWVGHSTLLVQIGGWNVLTDPVWSERASPVQWAGPARLAPPGLELDELPPIEAVVISHDH
ncbi:MAG TPA: MBL fold metallo-hydrolase, partial [Longimicrobiales bacterium]